MLVIFYLNNLEYFKGQLCDRIYILLEGEVEMINFDLKKVKNLKPGAYFGGIKPGMRQYAHYETKYFHVFINDYLIII